MQTALPRPTNRTWVHPPRLPMPFHPLYKYFKFHICDPSLWLFVVYRGKLPLHLHSSHRFQILVGVWFLELTGGQWWPHSRSGLGGIMVSFYVSCILGCFNCLVLLRKSSRLLHHHWWNITSCIHRCPGHETGIHFTYDTITPVIILIPTRTHIAAESCLASHTAISSAMEIRGRETGY